MVVSWTLQWFNITYATTFCAIPFLGFLPIHTTDVVYLMPQHCCYLLHTHTRVIFALLTSCRANSLAWSSWQYPYHKGSSSVKNTATAQLITDLRVSHLLTMFCHQWEAFFQHSTTQDYSSNLAFCSSMISGCVQHRTFIHVLHYFSPLPQILGYDRQANQKLMQVLLIIYKPEKECVFFTQASLKISHQSNEHTAMCTPYDRLS